MARPRVLQDHPGEVVVSLEQSDFISAWLLIVYGLFMVHYLLIDEFSCLWCIGYFWLIDVYGLFLVVCCF